MKKIIFMFCLCYKFISFGQDTLTYKNGGRIFNSNNQKLSSIEIKDLFSNNAEALTLYNSGKTKQTVGNVFLFGGFSIVAIHHYTQLQKAKNRESVSANRNTPYLVGGLFIVAAIPIKLGFSKKIKKSVELINNDVKKPKTSFNIESTTFVANANGVGFSITF